MELVRDAFELAAGAGGGVIAWIGRSDGAKTALLVLLLTPLLRFLWLGASTAYQHFLEWWDTRIEKCTIRLGPVTVSQACPLPGKVPIHCLIIRYGSDAYLETHASDQERFEGRIRYKILKSKLKRGPEDFYSGAVKLPVHRRLGTQFKLFFEVDSEEKANRYFDLLAELPELVEEVSITRYGAKPKVWFLLRSPQFTSVGEPGLRNNFFFPV